MCYESKFVLEWKCTLSENQIGVQKYYEQFVFAEKNYCDVCIMYTFVLVFHYMSLSDGVF